MEIAITPLTHGTRPRPGLSHGVFPMHVEIADNRIVRGPRSLLDRLGQDMKALARRLATAPARRPDSRVSAEAGALLMFPPPWRRIDGRLLPLRDGTHA